MNEKHFDKQRLFFKNFEKHLKWHAFFLLEWGSSSNATKAFIKWRMLNSKLQKPSEWLKNYTNQNIIGNIRPRYATRGKWNN